MDNDYIIQQLRKRHGDDYILSFFHDDVKRLKRDYWSEFEVSFLAYVLSFVNLKDIRSVSVVCKKWYSAFLLPGFWMRHISNKLSLHLESRKWLRDFDNFRLSAHETLRQQTEWLFMSGTRAFQIGTMRNKLQGLKRYSKEGTALLWFYDCYNYSDVHYTQLNGYIRNGKCISYTYNPDDITYKKVVVARWFKDEKVQVGHKHIPFFCEKMDGTVFKGQALNSPITVPHGSGKWIFPNGDTFEGDNVAFDGQPHGTGTDQNGKCITYFAGVCV